MARHARIIIDLGFGDSGKGTLIDHYARQYENPVIVRFNGGAQAAHNVCTASGKHHTFAQFGSGLFVPGARSFTAAYALFDPLAFVNEAEHLTELGLGNVYARHMVDGRAVVVSPFHKAMNRARELARGSGRHGTCGMGIGETMYESIVHPDMAVHVSDLRDPALLVRKLARIQEARRSEVRSLLATVPDTELVVQTKELFESSAEPRMVAEAMTTIARRMIITDTTPLKRASTLLFEGAQGVLLDEWHGFHPHTTWSKTNADNALAVLDEIDFDGPIEKVGVLRSYLTRHGEGPFPTEDERLTVPEPHNGERGWQGRFRRGWFDTVLAKYAIEATGGIDSFAMTHLDAVPMLQASWDGEQIPVSVGYRYNATAQAESVVRDLLVHERGGPLDYNETHTKFFQGDTLPLWESRSYADGASYAHTIAEMFEVKLSLVSHGPRAEDKVVL